MTAVFALFSIVASSTIAFGIPFDSGKSVTVKVSERVIPATATWTYEVNGKSTQYVVFTDPPRTLNDAKVACEAQIPSTQLVTVETLGELRFLQANLKPFVAGQPTKYNRAAFWTCGTDLIINSTRGEGQYWCYTGENLDTTFWNAGEPDDYEQHPETCVDLKVPASDPSADFSLNDELCTSELSYICESRSQICENPTQD